MSRGSIVVPVVGIVLSLGLASGVAAEERSDMDTLVGKQAELSPWAYAFRADLKVQEKPEAYFIVRRLQRLDMDYRPVSVLLTQGESKKGEPWPPQSGDWQLFSRQSVWDRGELLSAPSGTLQSALLWEGHMHLTRLELHWPKTAPKARQSVELRVYPTPYGWFGWQSDQRVTTAPEISADGSTWTYTGDWDGVDMVAAFVQPTQGTPNAVPQIKAYGPETWKRIDLEIEWGFAQGTQTKAYDGRIEGFFGLVGQIAPLAGDSGTEPAAGAWKSRGGGGGRRGITVSALCIQPADELVNGLSRYPYGGPRDTKFTLWTKSGDLTFLIKDLDKGPILAPECGIFVSKAGGGQTAREFAAKARGRAHGEYPPDDARASRGDVGRGDATGPTADVACRYFPARLRKGRRAADGGGRAGQAMDRRLADGRLAAQER